MYRQSSSNGMGFPTLCDPVSYTHLDVYKRQIQINPENPQYNDKITLHYYNNKDYSSIGIRDTEFNEHLKRQFKVTEATENFTRLRKYVKTSMDS